MRTLAPEELKKARKAARAIEAILKKRPWDHPLLSPAERALLRMEAAKNRILDRLDDEDINGR